MIAVLACQRVKRVTVLSLLSHEVLLAPYVVLVVFVGILLFHVFPAFDVTVEALDSSALQHKVLLFVVAFAIVLVLAGEINLVYVWRRLVVHRGLTGHHLLGSVVQSIFKGLLSGVSIPAQLDLLRNF